MDDFRIVQTSEAQQLEECARHPAPGERRHSTSGTGAAPSADKALSDLVELAADAIDVPIAALALIDGDRQRFEASTG